MARTAKGWSKRAPKTKAERRALLARCGRRAFLEPDRLAYPIMAKTGPCVVDCKGLRAAKARAAQYGRRSVRVRAAREASSASCARA